MNVFMNRKTTPVYAFTIALGALFAASAFLPETTLSPVGAARAVYCVGTGSTSEYEATNPDGSGYSYEGRSCTGYAYGECIGTSSESDSTRTDSEGQQTTRHSAHCNGVPLGA